MSLKGYAILTTGVLGSIFSFDLMWNFTSMEAIGAMFLSGMAGFAVAVAVLFGMDFADRLKEKAIEDEHTIKDPVFVRDDNGLEYMPMGKVM